MDKEIFKETVRKISFLNNENPEFMANLSKEEYKELINNMYLRFLNNGVIENQIVINNPEQFMEYIMNMAQDTDYTSYNLEATRPINVYTDRLGNKVAQPQDIKLDVPHIVAYYSDYNAQLAIYSPKEEQRKIEGHNYLTYYSYKNALNHLRKEDNKEIKETNNDFSR